MKELAVVNPVQYSTDGVFLRTAQSAHPFSQNIDQLRPLNVDREAVSIVLSHRPPLILTAVPHCAVAALDLVTVTRRTSVSLRSVKSHPRPLAPGPGLDRIHSAPISTTRQRHSRSAPLGADTISVFYHRLRQAPGLCTTTPTFPDRETPKGVFTE